MIRAFNKYTISTLMLSGALTLPALAQSTGTSQTQTDPAAATSSNGMNPSDNATYATGKPLEQQSKEGFWGHVNPFARKKWVNRQITPIKDRTNELDQLQAKNATTSTMWTVARRPVSPRPTPPPLSLISTRRTPRTALTRRTPLAGNASTKTDALHGTVSNLDQYQEVSSTTVKFVPGHTALGKTAKADLDDVATKLGAEKGYIIEVQGYSRSGVQTSQAMADSVVRYLVTEHQVPVYRIYKSGLGKNTAKAARRREATHQRRSRHAAAQQPGDDGRQHRANNATPQHAADRYQQPAGATSKGFGPPQGGCSLPPDKFAEIATQERTRKTLS